MKRLFLLLSLMLLGVLAGCGKDPVVADIEAFDKAGRAVFGDVNHEVSSFNRRAATAGTNEEKAAILGEMAQFLDGKAKQLATFQAKTPEVGKISSQVNEGLAAISDGANKARAAFRSANPTELTTATTQIGDGQHRLQGALMEFVKLAKEKNVKLAP